MDFRISHKMPDGTIGAVDFELPDDWYSMEEAQMRDKLFAVLTPTLAALWNERERLAA